MKRKNFVPALILLPVLLVSSSAAQRLTLADAIQRALAVSEELRISQEDVRKFELKAEEANAQRLPKLDFIGQYLFTSEVMTLDQPPTTIDLGTTSVTLPGKKTPFGDEHTVDFKLQVTQPLFTGFGLQKARSAARGDIVVKQAESKRIQWEIRCLAETTYLSAQKASEVVKIVRLQVDVLKRHLDDARRRVEEGVAPAEVAARADLALQQALLQLQEAQHRDQLSQVALRELLDLPDNGVALELDLLPENPEFEPANPQAVDYALRHRSEIEALQLQQDVLGELIGTQQAAYYPALYAFGTVNYGRPGIDRLANEWMFYQTAGLSLNWTLWDWNLRSGRTQQTKVAWRQMDEWLKALESRIRQEIRSAELSLVDAQQRYNVALEGVKLSEAIRTWVNERYSQGVATEAEYLDAEDDYSRSEIQKILALADYFQARVQLKRALGGDAGSDSESFN